ncbi:DinB family protein [Rubrolithibacter danxiaensis]|uniref:DinB family protein n=1 Tax=Rubrolithibacter danxiaensis TaxID=3390805 RepID=UPI003BF79B2C
MKRPEPTEYSPFHAGYIERANDNILEELEQQATAIPDFLRSIPEEKHDFSYAPDKWTLKQLVGHLTDTERIMAYRLLRFSRKDSTPLPGFEENFYVDNSNFLNSSFYELADEFAAVRQGNLFLFRSLKDEQLDLYGEANGNALSVRALLFILSGHLKHHVQIIKDRYL